MLAGDDRTFSSFRSTETRCWLLDSSSFVVASLTHICSRDDSYSQILFRLSSAMPRACVCDTWLRNVRVTCSEVSRVTAVLQPYSRSGDTSLLMSRSTVEAVLRFAH